MVAPAVMAGLSAASSMIGPLVGLLQGIKGPRKQREEAAQAREAARQKQLGQYKAATGGAQAQNQQQLSIGGTLPLPSPPVPQAAPAMLPAPPQVQLQQPQFGGQQGPLGGQRNDYMMKLLMQGDR